MQQRLVRHDGALAQRIAAAGTVVEFPVATKLIVEGLEDNDIFFLLQGEVQILVQGDQVASRGVGDAIGEMALIDPSASRSATAVSRSTVSAFRVSESAFLEIADEFPALWRAMAMVAMERLRERGKFHEPPHDLPVLFIGSSVEGLPIAKEIQLLLKHERVEVRVWSRGVFGPSGISVDELLAQANAADFSAFIFGPDDLW